jgi:hypothetical protein
MARRLITRLGVRPEQLLSSGGLPPGVQSLGSYVMHDVAQELLMCRRSDLIGMLVHIVDGVSGLSDHTLRVIASGLVLDKMAQLLCHIDEARGGSVVSEEYVVRVEEPLLEESTVTLFSPDGQVLARAKNITCHVVETAVRVTTRAKVVFNPAAPGGVRVHTLTTETPVAQRVTTTGLSVEEWLPQASRTSRLADTRVSNGKLIGTPAKIGEVNGKRVSTDAGTARDYMVGDEEDVLDDSDLPQDAELDELHELMRDGG